MDTKGNLRSILFIIVALFVVLIIGLMMALGGALLNWTADNIAPELSNLGDTGFVNLTDTARYTITPANSLIQTSAWMGGVLYVIIIIGSFGFAMMMRDTPNRWLIGLYIFLVFLLVLGSIFISNIYEDFYNGTDDFGARLQEQTLLSYMILYSPTIFTIIGFVTGIIVFSGRQEEYV